MANDLIKVLEEVRGTGAPGDPYTDGIYYDLTEKTTDDDGTPRPAPGMYESMKVIAESSVVVAPHVDSIDIVADHIDGTVDTAILDIARDLNAQDLTGTAYTSDVYSRIVKLAESINIDAVRTIAETATLTDIHEVNANVDSINTVSTDLGLGIASTIKITAENIAAVVALAAIEVKLNSLYTDKLTLDGLYSSKPAIDSLYADKATLDSLYADKLTLDSLLADKATLDSLVTDKATLDSLYADKLTLDSLYTDKATLDSIFADKLTLDSLVTDKAVLDSLYADKLKLDSLYADKITLDRIHTSIGNIDRVFTSADNIDTVSASISNVDNVAANIDSINDYINRYYGPLAVAPTIISHPTLVIGDQYFDTVKGLMQVYKATGWINAGSTINGTAERYVYVAGTASGDYDGVSLTTFPAIYDLGFLDVFVDGIKLIPVDDFDASSGVNVVMTQALPAGIDVEIIGYGAFDVTNAAQIKSMYESNVNTNEFSDAEQTKLETIEDSVMVLTNKTLDDITNYIHANALQYNIKANEPLVKGDIVTAVNTLGDGTIVAAKRNSLSVPAIGIVTGNLAINDIGSAIINGAFKGYDATGLAVGQILYPDAAGGLTPTPTIAHGNYNQPSAFVAEINGGNAQLVINFHSAHESANLISNQPAGNISSTNIQDTVNELDADISTRALAADTYTKAEVYTQAETNSNFLARNNTDVYSPSSSYEPATKAYVDAVALTGGGNVEITQVFRFIATEGQTTFPCTYIVGSLNITLNGYELDSSDYTAGDGLEVILNLGASDGDIVRVTAYGGADVYNKTQTNALLDGKLDKAGGIITSDLEIQGNLTTQGTVTSVNTTTVTTSDNLIVLNSGEVGTGVTGGESGIQIDRGLATDYEFKFDETDDSFKIGEIGSLQKVATREDAPVDQGLSYWDSTSNQMKTSSKTIAEATKIDATAVTSITFNTDGTMTVVIP